MCDSKVGVWNDQELVPWTMNTYEVMVPRLEQIELVPREEEAASHALIGKKISSSVSLLYMILNLH